MTRKTGKGRPAVLQDCLDRLDDFTSVMAEAIITPGIFDTEEVRVVVKASRLMEELRILLQGAGLRPGSEARASGEVILPDGRTIYLSLSPPIIMPNRE